ncbi:MAG: hypothetical protein IVW56_08270 [Candidatus Binataceae bacterium]|nr:hypothetical protein [Candidatus Binataceae bacterium]
MAPTIRISDNTYSRLQNPLIAKAFDDTPESAINKLLDFFEKNNGIPQPSSAQTNGSGRPGTFDPDNHPDLANTKIIAAEFAGQPFYPRALFGMKGLTWNGLVKVANQYAFEQANSSFDEFRKLTNSNVEKGKSTGRGFHYFREIDISIQYVDAEHAWDNILFIARQLKVPVTVEFELENQQRGTLTWTPATK